MADLDMVFREMLELDCKISNILKLSTYGECDGLGGLCIDSMDAGQLFLQDEFRWILGRLSDVHGRIRYLSRPVRETSRLHKNRDGRYETAQGHYYTSGSGIEALVTDGCREAPYWARTSVEHDGEGYFLVGYKDIPMDGLAVRIREGV